MLKCKDCPYVLYIGRAVSLYNRLFEHAFRPPWGAVDIVIGEVLRASETVEKKRSAMCQHLQAMASRSREEIAAALLLSVAVIHEKSERVEAEKFLLNRYPDSFGRGERNVWRPLEAEPPFYRDYLRLYRDYMLSQE